MTMQGEWHSVEGITRVPLDRTDTAYCVVLYADSFEWRYFQCLN